jgi:hypothetical protein
LLLRLALLLLLALLLKLLLLLLLGHVMADHAARRSPRDAMMAGDVPCDTANDSTLDAALRRGGFRSDEECNAEEWYGEQLQLRVDRSRHDVTLLSRSSVGVVCVHAETLTLPRPPAEPPEVSRLDSATKGPSPAGALWPRPRPRRCSLPFRHKMAHDSGGQQPHCSSMGYVQKHPDLVQFRASGD